MRWIYAVDGSHAFAYTGNGGFWFVYRRGDEPPVPMDEFLPAMCEPGPGWLWVSCDHYVDDGVYVPDDAGLGDSMEDAIQRAEASGRRNWEFIQKFLERN